MADSTAHLEYRADIDGLRAIAVLSVIVFHAFPQAVSGGFIGVDVFFVISGYLITGIIFKTITDRTFSFADFYYRRVVRIFPALILVLIFCAAFGWLNLLTEDYKNLGKDIAAAVGFVSNFVAMHDAGYFDRASGLKPLLHLWSLGVEEQFYLLWPAAVFISFSRRTALGWTIFAALAISFAFNVWFSNQNPILDFYSPVTRFWELMIGAAIAFAQLDARHPHPGSNAVTRAANVQSIAGLCGLMIAAYGFTERISFPGWWALFPAVGTALMIAAGPRAIVNRAILSNRFLVGVGLISYPLYLWH